MTSYQKLLLIGVGVIGVLYGARKAVYLGYIPRPDVLKTVIPLKVEQVHAEVLSNTGHVAALPLPSSSVVSSAGKPVVNYEIWAWNAQMGLILANGGASTTVGSAMARHGVFMRLKRQDDTGQMQSDLLTFASALHDGNSNPQSGAHFVTIMGDGAAQFFAALNPKLEKLGPEYHAEIVGSHGYSRGEDGLWGQAEWRSNPQSMRGALIAGVLRDGDWNFGMDYEYRNKIPNNPDDKVYDPNAVNWVNADTYTKAAEMYVEGFCEDLPLKDKPRETKHVCVNGVVTWTPGDVTLAKKKGGLVPILTSRENPFQMPAVMIGIHKWDQSHPQIVSGLLAASFEAADQIKTNPIALHKAAGLSASVYQEQNTAYWETYYKGVTEPDKGGMMVPLGGSTVSNLADNLQLFGISGSLNILKTTYETFGNIVVQQYPNLVPSYPKLASVEDVTYLLAARDEMNGPSGEAEHMTYSPTAPIKEQGGDRNYSIQFRTGSAEIMPESFAVLDEIYKDQAFSRMEIMINGYTDSTGTFEGNKELSKARADSVKRYLQSKSLEIFPDARIRTEGYGQDRPVASNTTAEGRAQNRRVQIVLGIVG